ncbi:STAS/SEC14 domain-containing protein [Pontibacter ruber]|uniref:STAS/SEC14 domain-containing protein n=1 Tax=Pontibacter ruber TaxID=1343895 RepID=A0ABW5CTT9_9BACT|nr:hypothetical protein [Pontibacter ruber]
MRETALHISEPLELRHEEGDVFVTLQQKKDYIEAKWHGHITADDVVTAAKAYLELIQAHPCPKLLNDKTEVTGDWEEANDWLEFEWLPKVTAAGLRYFAHVFSENMFSRLSARDLAMRISPPLQMSAFEDRKAAESWLAECR